MLECPRLRLPAALQRPIDCRHTEVEMPNPADRSCSRALAILIPALIAFAYPTQASPQAGSPPAAPSAPAAPAPVAPAGFDWAGQREEVFKAFYATGLDTSTAYTVTNLPIKKDNMTLLLKQGTVYLMKPIGGEVTGAAFIGDGEADMTPPGRTQRFMLNKYSGAETLKEPFTEAILRFTDGTDRTLRALGKSSPPDAAVATRADSLLSDRDGWLDGSREVSIELKLLENRISGLSGQD